MGNWLDDHEAKKKREKEAERIKKAQSNREAQIYREKNGAMLARLMPIVEPILDQFEPHIARANKNGFFMTWARSKGDPAIIIRRHPKRYKGDEREMDATRSVHIYGSEKGFSLFFYEGDIRLVWSDTFKRHDEHIYGANRHKPCKSIDKIPFNSMQEPDVLNILQWLATDQRELPRLGKSKKWFGLFRE